MHFSALLAIISMPLCNFICCWICSIATIEGYLNYWLNVEYCENFKDIYHCDTHIL